MILKNDKLPLAVYFISLSILLLGAVSIVAPTFVYRDSRMSLTTLMEGLHGKGIMMSPFFLIVGLFFFVFLRSTAPGKWIRNISGVVVALIPVFYFIYLANIPPGDALSSGMIYLFSLISAPIGYMLGWGTAGFAIHITRTFWRVEE